MFAVYPPGKVLSHKATTLGHTVKRWVLLGEKINFCHEIDSSVTQSFTMNNSGDVIRGAGSYCLPPPKEFF